MKIVILKSLKVRIHKSLVMKSEIKNHPSSVDAKEDGYFKWVLGCLHSTREEFKETATTYTIHIREILQNMSKSWLEGRV